MKKLAVHQVVRVAMVIYLLSLSFGVCFSAKKRVRSKSIDQERAHHFSTDTEYPNDASNSINKLGSWPAEEEDDDDSVRSLFNRIASNFGLLEVTSLFSVIAYPAIHQDISTPPPRC